MLAIRMACEATFRAFSALFSSKRQNISAMAAPIGTDVGERLEAMMDTVVELCFVRVRLSVGLGDAFGDHVAVTLLVASVLAVCTLHACGVFEEISTVGAAHNVVELLLYEFVAILLEDLLFTLSNGALTTQTHVERLLIVDSLVKTHREVYPSDRLQGEPAVNTDRPCLGNRTTRRILRASWGCLSHSASSDETTLAWWWLELRRWWTTTGHLVSGDPSRIVELCFNLLTPHFFSNIGDSDPQHTNRQRMVAGLVIYSQLDLVRLVNIEFVQLVCPAISSSSLGSSLDRVFDLHHDEGFRTSAESACSCMVDIGDALNPHDQMARERLPCAWNIQTIIYFVSARVPMQIRALEHTICTLATAFDIDMKILVAFQGLFQ